MKRLVARGFVFEDTQKLWGVIFDARTILAGCEPHYFDAPNRDAWFRDVSSIRLALVDPWAYVIASPHNDAHDYRPASLEALSIRHKAMLDDEHPYAHGSRVCNTKGILVSYV